MARQLVLQEHHPIPLRPVDRVVGHMLWWDPSPYYHGDDMNVAIRFDAHLEECRWCGHAYNKNPSRQQFYCSDPCRRYAHNKKVRDDARAFRLRAKEQQS